MDGESTWRRLGRPLLRGQSLPERQLPRVCRAQCRTGSIKLDSDPPHRGAGCFASNWPDGPVQGEAPEHQGPPCIRLAVVRRQQPRRPRCFRWLAQAAGAVPRSSPASSCASPSPLPSARRAELPFTSFRIGWCQPGANLPSTITAMRRQSFRPKRKGARPRRPRSRQRMSMATGSRGCG